MNYPEKYGLRCRLLLVLFMIERKYMFRLVNTLEKVASEKMRHFQPVEADNKRIVRRVRSWDSQF